MKQKIINFILLPIIAIMVVVGVQVYAFNGPSSGTPADPINTATDSQSKKGGIVAKYFGALAQNTPLTSQTMPPEATFDGVVYGKSLLKTTDGLFKKQLLMSGNDYQFKIGSPNTFTPTELPNPSLELFDRAQYTAPLTIDLVGRGDNAPTGKNAMEMLSGAMCKDYVTTVVSTAGIEFKNRTTGAPIDVVAKQVRLSGGAPDLNRVLVSTNANGDATWATIKVQGNQITYLYDGRTVASGDSPVTTEPSLCVTPSATPHWDIAWEGCKFTYDGLATTNIGMGQPVEYGTATCKNSSGQIVTGCTGAPWTDMDGTKPIRPANSSLAFCPSGGGGSSSGPLSLWRCHATNTNPGGGQWIAYPGPSNQETCSTQSAPPHNPAIEGDLACNAGTPRYICQEF